MVTERSGAPFTANLPVSHSRSSGEASSRCAAICFALSRILRETTAVAAPAVGVLREA
jgi:hypothetical protein